MKHLKYFSVSIGLATLCCLVPACSTQKTDDKIQASEVAVASTDNAAVEVSEDKSSLAGYYKLDHIKEWYPERILPPPFDFSVDLSDKSIVELSLLRNEIFARNGYLFDDAVLRGYFNQFDWYQPIFDVPEFKIQLTRQEQDFVNRVLVLEKELSKERYVREGDHDMVDLAHVYNLGQFKSIDDRLKDLLAKNNFAIVPATHDQFFHVYDNNHYQYVPSFITTDIYLQVMHKHFSTLLQKIEAQKLAPLLTTLLEDLARRSLEFQKNTADPPLKDAAQWTTTYLAIASHLISGTAQITPGMDDVFKTETEKIANAAGVGSKFLDSDIIQYGQFKPRGNYTTSEERARYFRCVKWLNTAPINIRSDERFLSSILIASFVKRYPDNMTSFRRFNDAINFITGDEDNMSIANLIALISDAEAANPSALNDPAKLDALRKKLLDVSMDKIRGKEGAEEVSEPAILFTAGRYSFDAEIMSRLIHVLQPEPKRTFPKGLDVLASFGNRESVNILLNEYREEDHWHAYPDTLRRLQETFPTLSNWDRNIYAKTMEVIQSLDHKESGFPLFMKTPAWDRKNLVTSLAAWTELKHDMLLYSEQPYAAEAGEGGGPPPPQQLGYVEPNVRFWETSLELLKLQENRLSEMGLLTDETADINKDLKEIGEMLLTISKKELAHESITPDELDYLSWLGGRIEYLTFRIFGSDHLPEQEKDVALVADVYNYNGQFLEEAVGMVDEIYVVAKINGKPYLTKGAVFSYYEFTSDTPLTDDEWREQLASGRHAARPPWTDGITVRVPSLESKPTYSF